MEKSFKTTDGAEICYQYIAGDAAKGTVVLMHGWGCNSSTLKMLENIAVTNGFTVINVDFPGFGNSPEPDSIWGVEEYTRLIEQMLKNEGVDSPILVGHSFGGRVAILYASRNQADRVILVDAAGLKPHRSMKYYVKVYSFKLVKKLSLILFSRKKAEQIIERYRSKQGSSDYAQASQKMRAILSKVVNEDLTKALPSVAAPTLLIWGEKDTATPLSDAKKMERLIPDAGLVSFPNAGHYSFLDEPMQFTAVFTNFLNTNLKTQ
mgnify:FL=1